MPAPAATTLKLPVALKRRVVAAAKAADKSPHAFMLKAIQRQTLLDEQRRAFIGEALDARAEALETGRGYAAEEVHRYITARARGEQAARPKARAWRK
jgi:predicted transcriptional regulator